MRGVARPSRPPYTPARRIGWPGGGAARRRPGRQGAPTGKTARMTRYRGVTVGRRSFGGVAVAMVVAVLALVIGACSSSGTDTESGQGTEVTTTTVDRSGQRLRTTTVFRPGEDGYATYRIPAVVRTPDGTLIAFAEGRVSGAADDGNVDLLSKRSTDGGRTWGELRVVADMGSDFIGNPSPVVDAESGRVVLLATHKAGTDTEIEILTGTGADTSREYLLTSDDRGETWSDPVEITASVKKPGWRWYSVGPGHAFQLRSGPHAGRLVAAANHSDASANYGAHLLLSDDGGKTWRIGATDTPRGGPRHPNEATAAALPDGTIVVSARDQDGQDQWHRLRATSTDGGETFVAPFEDQEGLVTPVVQASMLWVGRGPGGKATSPGRLLLSAPSGAQERVDLRVRSSLDAGVTWSKGFLVARGPAAYSDLVALPGGVVGVLLETGDQRADERIDFATFGAARLDR